MKKEAKKEENLEIVIPAPELREFSIRLIGDSPLIVHAWADKAKKMILDKQTKKATKGREVRNPFNEFCDSLYWMTERPEHPTMEDVQNAQFGFPSVAFKASAIDGGFFNGVIAKKTIGRAAFQIIGDMVEIKGTPTMREDMVRIGGQSKTADLRYRAEFKEWSTTFKIRFNPLAMSAEQIVNLFNYGGFSVGVGEWRPSRDGSYGQFHVASEEEA